MKAVPHIFSFAKVPAALSRQRLGFLPRNKIGQQSPRQERTEIFALVCGKWKESFRVDLARVRVMAGNDFYSRVHS